MAIHYRTQGICLKKTYRGEADELLTFYTKEFGKLKILGKAIRKISSKLRGGTELFYLSEIEFIQGKTHKTLTDAVLANKFTNIRKDLDGLRIAYHIAGVLDELAAKEEKDERIWELLSEVLEKLNNYTLAASGYWLIYYYFFWHLVSILGYKPDIAGCSIGGNKINCDIIKILKVILRKDWRILSRLKLEKEHTVLLKNVSEWYSTKIHDEK